MVTIEKALELLKRGHVVAVPTEGVYGLSADATNPKAVERLLKLKNRSEAKGFILITEDLKNCSDWLQPISPEHQNILNKNWPGPVTYLIPSTNHVPIYLRGEHDNLAIRISAHPVLSKLAKGMGQPLISTSANLSGQPAARLISEVQDYFGMDFSIVEGELGGLNQPTAIFELSTGKKIR